MGWVRYDNIEYSNSGFTWRWVHPDREYPTFATKDTAPISPDTDANDTEAVIRWLNEQDRHVKIVTTRHGAAVMVGRLSGGLWEGDNWKIGVCELALKVIDNDD